jgi:phosphoglycolate phosphatase-like HAD superfamily hydrolase
VNGEIALFWDIDGTLLTTARAGVFALEDALEEVTGTHVDLQDLESAGLTEHAVAQGVFAAAGIEADDDLIDRFLRAYERHLPTSLPRREGRVLPGVREILEDLAPRNGVHSFLLTGNTPAGAQAKLTHYGLSGFFEHGAFCVGPGTRTDIAREAAKLAHGARELYVIGDTPHDIECGKAIGARSIAVATGSYSTDELAAHEPWALLTEIPDPDAFRELVGLS